MATNFTVLGDFGLEIVFCRFEPAGVFSASPCHHATSEFSIFLCLGNAGASEDGDIGTREKSNVDDDKAIVSFHPNSVVFLQFAEQAVEFYTGPDRKVVLFSHVTRHKVPSSPVLSSDAETHDDVVALEHGEASGRASSWKLIRDGQLRLKARRGHLEERGGWRGKFSVAKKEGRICSSERVTYDSVMMVSGDEKNQKENFSSRICEKRGPVAFPAVLCQCDRWLPKRFS